LLGIILRTTQDPSNAAARCPAGPARGRAGAAVSPLPLYSSSVGKGKGLGESPAGVRERLSRRCPCTAHLWEKKKGLASSSVARLKAAEGWTYRDQDAAFSVARFFALAVLLPPGCPHWERLGASVPPLTSVARLTCARTDAITGPPLEPAPQKQLKTQKKTQNTPGAGHPTSVAQIGVGGLCWGRSFLNVCVSSV
jgi:hypothetical protein